MSQIQGKPALLRVRMSSFRGFEFSVLNSMFLAQLIIYRIDTKFYILTCCQLNQFQKGYAEIL